MQGHQNALAIHQFCEPKYELSPYIAEFTNTISSSVYIIVGLCEFAVTTDIYARLSLVALILVGIGSVLFHATMRYKAQLMGEIPMLILITTFSLSKIDHVKFMRGRPHIVIAYTCIAIILYILTRNYALFLFEFGVSVLFDLNMYMSIKPLSLKSIALGRKVLSFLSIGLLAWILEHVFCEAHPFVFLLHSIWHFLSAYAAFNAIRLNSRIRIEKSTKTLKSY